MNAIVVRRTILYWIENEKEKEPGRDFRDDSGYPKRYPMDKGRIGMPERKN